jgi:tetratricopeptide (TPR) repeat protein
MRWIGVILSFVICVSSALACYNDNDTYLTELRDNLDVTNAIIGRFTLYPVSYYKKRIEIQKAILKKDPTNLDAYDNISVAYDRIGDGESALKWITEKRKHLANAPKLHLYSTEANEGTFLIVRWIRGHKKGDIKDAIEAEKHIAKALDINPDAHFGREFSQLYCIRAMIMAGKDTDDWEKYFTQDLLVIADKDHVDRKKLRYGIAGMMVLGAAWNAPVFIQAIAELVPEEGQIASLCIQKLRVIGKSPNGHPDLRYIDERFIDKDLVKEFPILAKSTTHGRDFSIIQDLLKNGADFQIAQEAWIEQQIANGKHPDNGDDIWKGYQEVPPIPKEKLANSTFFSRSGTFILYWSFQTLGCCIFIPMAVILLMIRDIRRRKLRNF